MRGAWAVGSCMGEERVGQLVGGDVGLYKPGCFSIRPHRDTLFAIVLWEPFLCLD